MPLRRPGPLRSLQRHRPHRGLLRGPQGLPALPAGRPAPQPHAVHMAAVTQVSHRHSEGRAYYDRKVKESKTTKEALRCLKRRISDAIFAHLVADTKRRAQAAKAGPGGQKGNGSVSSVAGSHPERQLFGQATPRPVPTYVARRPHAAGMPRSRSERNPEKPLDAKRSRSALVEAAGARRSRASNIG
jgi:transposase